jgi:carboxyl-terminal processing protease
MMVLYPSYSERQHQGHNETMKKYYLLIITLMLCNAAALDASTKTVGKVFEYIDTYYVEPVNYSTLYRDTLRHLTRDFPGKIKMEERGSETFHVACSMKETDFRILKQDQASNVKQLGKIIQTCVPEKFLKKLQKNNQTVEQITLVALLGSLDPHSSFMTAEMYKELNTDLHGSFGGIGAEITVQNGMITVVSPIDDTPAFTAGIKTGDQIIRINGEPTKGMTVVEAVRKIRGPKNTKVNLTIKRVDMAKLKNLMITRNMINIKTVKYKLYEDHIGYIRLSSFQENTTDELQTALREINKKEGSLKGLLLDMRNNPGGILDQAIKVSDQFMKSGIIVSTKGRKKNTETTARARNHGDEPAYPIVILVNEGTASAAEIVSGALQENRKALIVGTQTFGKGSVQTVFPLEDGSALKLTTARYYTPKGRSVQEKGITPDLVVGKIQGFREKDLRDYGAGNRPKGKNRIDAKNAKNIEADREIQLQSALQLLRKIIVTGDLQKGLQAFNTAKLH